MLTCDVMLRLMVRHVTSCDVISPCDVM